MSETQAIDLWVKTLQAYRALHGGQQPVIRAGTNPVMDLIIMDQVDASLEVWFIYPNVEDSAAIWTAILAFPGYEERLAVAPLSYIIEGLTGDRQDLADDLVVLAVQPNLAQKSRKM